MNKLKYIIIPFADLTQAMEDNSVGARSRSYFHSDPALRPDEIVLKTADPGNRVFAAYPKLSHREWLAERLKPKWNYA